MGVRKLFPILLCFNSVRSFGLKQPRVTTENGVVVGKYEKSYYGDIYQSFEGIPYAKPPIDDKRFKEAEPLRGSWIGEWNATARSSACLQYDHFSRTRDENSDWVFSTIGDEDCLYLNVHTGDGGTNKDVIFIIHGGAFMFGCNHDYSPHYLDLKNKVAVVANYRLGPLGFLTTGDFVSPGNNGLKDQVLALEWIQRNIAAFGGDPKKVTLVGLSAGGASVHYHFLSEMSNGLFTKGYSFSGTALGPWSFVRDGVEKTKQLAASLGCPTKDSKSLVKCLRRRPARQIVEQTKNFQNWIYNPFTVFGPVKEIDSPRPFLDEEPLVLLEQGRIQDLPWITSFTSEDGLYPAGDFVDDDRFLEQLNERWESIAPSLLFYEEQPGRTVPVWKDVRQYYLGKKAISRETWKEVVKMLSDRLFIAPAIEAAALQAKANSQPVYLYSYHYEGGASTARIMSRSNSSFGASHGDDFIYVIKFAGLESRVTEEDEGMAKFLLELLNHFIKHGSPPVSLNWKPVSKKGKSTDYLQIKSVHDVKMRNVENEGNVAYLKKLFAASGTNKDEL